MPLPTGARPVVGAWAGTRVMTMDDAATIELEGELAALERARQAVEDKLAKLAGISGGGADAVADEYIDAVVAGTIDKLQHELVVFGRIDDEHVWRVGLYGIDSGGEQLVIDWRARFAEAFYQAGFDDPHDLVRRVSYVGSIDDLLIEEFVTGEVSGSSPLMAELSRSRGASMKAAVATLQSEQDRLVRLDPTARLVLRGGPGTGKTVVGLHRAALAGLQRPPGHGRSHPRGRAERPVPQVRVGGAADAR